MGTRRFFLLACAALVVSSRAGAQARPTLVRVYKSPTCGCCGLWEAHMRAAGFRVESHPVPDVTAIKRSAGVPPELWSCHTALVEGYAVEGHVPASDVKRLLAERPRARGVAVPGMPAGSPGMEQGAAQPYKTFAFDERRSWAFAQH